MLAELGVSPSKETHALYADLTVHLASQPAGARQAEGPLVGRDAEWEVLSDVAGRSARVVAAS